jgi:hypothetical protein
MDFPELFKTFGPTIGIIIFFLWRDWKREDDLNARVKSLEEYNQTTLVALVKEAIQVIATNTQQLQWTGTLIQSCHAGRHHEQL